MTSLAPAGTPIGLRALARCLWRGVRTPSEGEFVAAIAAYLKVEHAFCISQGRAALSLSLELLAENSGKRRVVVPAYTCYSVPAAVAKAGLQVLSVDIDRSTLDYDRNALERLDCSDVVAIVSSSLFGLPGDLTFLEAFGQRRGVAVIDDAAQALGARVDGRHVGTFGYVGFYSLGRG